MRNILIVIDMQNDFIDGSLGTKEAEAIVDNVKNKIRSYDPADVIATMDTHETNYLQRAREPPAGGTRNPASLPEIRADEPGGGLAGAFSSYNPASSFCSSS